MKDIIEYIAAWRSPQKEVHAGVMAGVDTDGLVHFANKVQGVTVFASVNDEEAKMLASDRRVVAISGDAAKLVKRCPATQVDFAIAKNAEQLNVLAVKVRKGGLLATFGGGFKGSIRQ